MKVKYGIYDVHFLHGICTGVFSFGKRCDMDQLKSWRHIVRMAREAIDAANGGTLKHWQRICPIDNAALHWETFAGFRIIHDETKNAHYRGRCPKCGRNYKVLTHA